jgi:hypothetical protein
MSHKADMTDAPAFTQRIDPDHDNDTTQEMVKVLTLLSQNPAGHAPKYTETRRAFLRNCHPADLDRIAGALVMQKGINIETTYSCLKILFDEVGRSDLLNKCE